MTNSVDEPSELPPLGVIAGKLADLGVQSMREAASGLRQLTGVQMGGIAVVVVSDADHRVTGMSFTVPNFVDPYAAATALREAANQIDKAIEEHNKAQEGSEAVN